MKHVKLKRHARTDRGSITPLAIGFVVIGLALITIVTVVSDVYMAHRKLYAIVDSAALAAAESYEPIPGGEPTFEFRAAGIEQRANDYISEIPPPSNLSHVRIDAYPADDSNVEVVARARYHPVLLSPFVPNGFEITSSTRARGTLR